jgi:hypothetical protein
MAQFEVCNECGHDRWIVFRNTLLRVDGTHEAAALMRCECCDLERPVPESAPAVLPEPHYTLDGTGPYLEDQLRDRLRAFRSVYGREATLRRTVHELGHDGRVRRRLDAGRFA